MTFCKHLSEISSASFVKLPRAVLDFDMSICAKYLYALLLSRAQLSAKNGYIDQQGIYVFCTVDEAARLLNCSRDKAIATLRQLEFHHLIHREEQSAGRTRRIRFYPVEATEPQPLIEKPVPAVEPDVSPVEEIAPSSRENPPAPVENPDPSNIIYNKPDFSETEIKEPENNMTEYSNEDLWDDFPARRLQIFKEIDYFRRIIDGREDPQKIKQEAADRLGCTVEELFSGATPLSVSRPTPSKT